MITDNAVIENTWRLSISGIWSRMKKMTGKKIHLIILMILAALLPLCAAESQTVRSYLPSLSSERGLLPVDGVIGQTAEPDCDDAHKALSAALSEDYSFDWTQTYIAEPVRAALVRLFDSWFSTHLPCSAVLMSVSHPNADGSIGINVRVGDSCMSFVMSDGVIVSMKEIGF